MPCRCQFFTLPPGLRSVQVAAYEGWKTLSNNRAMNRTLDTFRLGTPQKRSSQIFIFRVAIWPRDARPNRSTLDLRRPCEEDAKFRVCRSRLCLLCAHRFSADSVMVDAGRLARPRPYARARCGSGKGKNVNDTYRNYQMRMTSSIEIIKYNSLTSSVVRKQHNVA